MNELVYVLAVEALVFGALCTATVAQRLDVFQWPVNSTWPVLTTTLQVLLLNAHLLLWVCCFVSAGRFASFAPDVRDACARSAGRLATAASLAVVYVAALLSLRRDFSDCVLCQLLDTTCADAPVIFSRAVYLAVLLPLAALQAGLLVAAAGMCKEQRVAPRRLATTNCAVVLAAQVLVTLEHNAGRLPVRCGGALASGAPLSAPHVIVLALLLYALDATADLVAEFVLAGRAAVHLPFFFTACRAASLAAPWGLAPLSDDGVLPWQLLVAHSALALLLCVLDVADVWLQHFDNTSALASSAEPPASPVKDTSVGMQVPRKEPAASTAQPLGFAPRERGLRAAFEVEPARRRRFVLAFNNKARWPSQETAKKTA
jgi:hypothetical protein